MSVGIVGIGDVVALLNVVRGLAAAINGSRSSAAEYQEVKRELEGLEEALKCHQQLLQARRDDPALNAIFRSTQSTAEDCQRCIEAFSRQTAQFDRSLGVGNGGNICKDVTRKIRWHMEKKQEVMRFRAEMGQHLSTLNMLFGLANLNMQRIATENIDFRLNTLELKIDSNREAQTSSLIELQEHVDKGNTHLVGAVKDIQEELKLGWLGNVIFELKDRVSQVFITTGTTFSAVQRIESILLSRSEKTLYRTFILEDALGRKTQHDLMCINSWDNFDAMIEIIFRDLPGHAKVAKKQYVFQDQKTNREIKRSTPWSVALLPDQHVNMCLLFRKRASKRKRFYCPYCHVELKESEEGQIPCRNSKCGMSHQRRTEVMDVNEDEEMPAFDLFDGQLSDSEDLHVQPGKEETSKFLVKREKPTLPNKVQEDMSVFKRVIVVEVEMNLMQSKSTEYKSRKSSTSRSPLRHHSRPISGDATPDGYSPRYKSSGDYAVAANVSRSKSSWSAPQHNAKRRRSYSYRVFLGESDEDDGDNAEASPVYQAYEQPLLQLPKLRPQPHQRRQSSPMAQRISHSSRRPTSPKKPPPARKATEADARKHRIPAGFSLTNWDPSEQSIMILGRVFDYNSLGKWIYDWTVYRHGPATPVADMAGELWLLLIQLFGKVKRAEECMPRIETEENREMVEDFIESGERLMNKLKKLLKSCEIEEQKSHGKQSEETAMSSTTTSNSPIRDPDLNTTTATVKAPATTSKDAWVAWDSGLEVPTTEIETASVLPQLLGKNAEKEFVDSIFGRDRQLEQTEKFMSSIRLWNLRFDANCEDILRRPGQL